MIEITATCWLAPAIIFGAWFVIVAFRDRQPPLDAIDAAGLVVIALLWLPAAVALIIALAWWSTRGRRVIEENPGAR